MLLFYVDEPLSDKEAVQLAEALADMGERPEVVQRRIPFLYPVGDTAGAIVSTGLLSACLARAGLGEREVCILTIPRCCRRSKSDVRWRREVE